MFYFFIFRKIDNNKLTVLYNETFMVSPQIQSLYVIFYFGSFVLLVFFFFLKLFFFFFKKIKSVVSDLDDCFRTYCVRRRRTHTNLDVARGLRLDSILEHFWWYLRTGAERCWAGKQEVRCC